MASSWRLAIRAVAAMVASLLVLITLVFFFFGVSKPPPTEDCPFVARFLPLPRTPVTSGDFLEMRVQSGYGSWNPYVVRIYGDGQIERETTQFSESRKITFGCPLPDKDRHGRIAANEARALLEKARDGGFRTMCGFYRAKGSVLDAGSSQLTLSLGGQSRTVSNAAGQPPPLYRELVEKTASLTSIQRFADRSGFSPERDAECKAFGEAQARLFQDRRQASARTLR